MDKPMNIKETAEYLHITERALRTMARQNKIPNKKIGQQRLFIKEIIDDWLKTA